MWLKFSLVSVTFCVRFFKVICHCVGQMQRVRFFLFFFLLPPSPSLFGSSGRKSRTFLQSSRPDPVTRQVPSAAPLSTKFSIFPDVWWVVFDGLICKLVCFQLGRFSSDFRMIPSSPWTASMTRGATWRKYQC